MKVFKQMLDSQAFVDCTLACEGKLIKAHKMILAACSPYLHTILEENTSKHPIIFLPHLKYSDIRALVDYMYCGEVYISFDHLPSLLKAAEVLRIKGLSDVTNGTNGGGGNGNNNNNGINGNSGNGNNGLGSLGIGLGSLGANGTGLSADTGLGVSTDLGSLGGIGNGTNISSSSDNLQQEEENDYDLGSNLTLDPEVSFVDDCSNEDGANNEDESTNGESPNKTFLCHLCRCSFTAQSSLRRHMHRHYTDRERFECEICHNSYSRKDYLKEHKKTKHQASL